MLFPECINWAHRSLENAIAKFPDRPVAWGNTNLKPKDYLPALELAERSRRPVQFIRSGYELEPVTLQQLIQRNLRRFFKTGRYIPSIVVERTLGTSTRMLQEQFVTPESLCGIVGFTLDGKNGRVARDQSREQTRYQHHELKYKWELLDAERLPKKDDESARRDHSNTNVEKQRGAQR